MATKKKIKFDPDKDRVVTFSRDGEKLSEVNGVLKSDFYSGIEKMCYLSDEYCIFYKGKKMGILDSKGVLVTPAEWESIDKQGDVFKISMKNKVTKDFDFGYINLEGDLLFDPSEYYVDVNCQVSDGRIMVSSIDADRRGAFDLEGNLVIAPKFFRMDNFHHNLSVTAEEKGKFGLLDRNGNWVLAPEYSFVGGFHKYPLDYCVVCKDGKYSLIDKDCNVVAGPIDKPIYQYCKHDGIFLAIGDKKNRGVVNPNGEILLPMEYDDVYFLNGEYICFKNNFGYGLADMKGNVLLSDKESISVEHGLIVVNDNEVMKPDGTPVCKAEEKVKIFEHVILVSDDYKSWGIVDHDGNVLLEKEWENVHISVMNMGFEDGFINLSRDGKTIYVDEKGKIKICLDTYGWAFSDGYAIIGKKDDYSIINHSGEVVAEQLAHVSPLGGGYFFCNNAEENAPNILNVNNGEQSGIPARVVGKPNNGLVKIQASDLNFGIVSISTSKVVVEPLYSQILLTADGIWGYLPKTK